MERGVSAGVAPFSLVYFAILRDCIMSSRRRIRREVLSYIRLTVCAKTIYICTGVWEKSSRHSISAPDFRPSKLCPAEYLTRTCAFMYTHVVLGDIGTGLCVPVSIMCYLDLLKFTRQCACLA